MTELMSKLEMGVFAPCCLIKACADNFVTAETPAGSL